MKTAEDVRENFLSNSLAHYDATVKNEYRKANMLHHSLMDIYKVAKARKLTGVFAEFVNHDNESVRLWAATFLLPTDCGTAVEALSKLRDSKSEISMMAGMVLDLWEKGRLDLL